MGNFSASGFGGGALQGAGTGAIVGSAVPGIGTAIGALGGGLIGGLSGGKKGGGGGGGKDLGHFSNVYGQLLNTAQGNLSQIRDRFNFAERFIANAPTIGPEDARPIFAGFKDQIEFEFDRAAAAIAESAPVGGQRRAQETQLRGDRARGLAEGVRAEKGEELELKRLLIQDLLTRGQLITQLGIAGLGIPQLLISGSTAGQQIVANVGIAEGQRDLGQAQKKGGQSTDLAALAILAGRGMKGGTA